MTRPVIVYALPGGHWAGWLLLADLVLTGALLLRWIFEGLPRAFRDMRADPQAAMTEAARQQGRHRTGSTDPFPAVAAPEHQPVTQPEFATPADRAAYYQRPPLRGVGKWEQ